jgi:hypothetical protein
MGIKQDRITFSTRRSVQDLGRSLQGVLAAVKAGSIEQLQSPVAALAQFDDRADIQIVAGGATIGSMWEVRVFVVDTGEDRRIELIAIGEGGFGRAMAGARYSNSLSSSIKKRDQIAAALR